MSQIIVSKTTKPQLNLAFEEYLLKNATVDCNIFFLWQNDETVVIGRNQNPWNECHVENIKKDNINLVRRLTGGGAVFHDLGNLNFTFISKNSESKIEENFELVNHVLNEFGIDSKFTGKNDLVVDKKKISGNAFVIEGEILCHHGTLLIDADLNRLNNYLSVSDLKLKSKGINSVVSRVANVKSMNSSITVKLIKERLIKSFKEKADFDSTIDLYDEKEIEKKLLGFDNRYNNWEWNYGSTPNFEATFEDRFTWGEIQINFNVDDALIKETKVYTDCNDSRLAILIEGKMLNHKFDKSKIIDTLKEIDHSNIIDICDLFESKMF